MVGRTVRQYEILEQLGAGGMGVVYRAHDLMLNRYVALKFLARHLVESDAARKRFYQEAQTISALSHPNIAVIYEIGEDAGEPYLALEYLAGGTLFTRLLAVSRHGGRITPGEALETAAALFDGLGHAHRHGVLHRDIKPANLMYNQEGLLKISDFGLAKLTGAPALSRGDERPGTLSYMSPEQLEGKGIDKRADLFSAGVVLYEMLACVCPFAGDSDAATVLSILRTVPEPLEDMRPDVTPEVWRIIARLLEKDPAKRYSRAEEVLVDVRTAQRNADQHPTVSIARAIPLQRRIISRRLTLSRRRALTWGLPAAVGVGAIGFALTPAARRYFSDLLPGAHLGPRRIAVMPLDHIEDDPAQSASNAAFCDGLTENLASTLSRLRQFQATLLVVPSSEVRRLKGVSVDAIRRAFGVNLAITGSVQKLGQIFNITLNLVDASTGYIVPGHSISRRYTDLDQVQDGVETDLAKLLDLDLQREARTALAANKSAVPGAWELYTQGIGLLQQPDKKANLDQAMDLFNRAVDRDPHYALAWAGMSDARVKRYAQTNDPQWLAPAREAAMRATDLNAQLPAGYVSLGQIYQVTGRYEQAVQTFEHALQLDPVSSAAFRGLGSAWEQLNQRKKAEETYARAVRLSPDDWFAVTDLATFYSRTGQFEKAAAQFRRTTEIAPGYYKSWRNLGGLYILMNRFADANVALQKSIDIQPSDSAYSNLGTVLYAQGRYREAARTYENALQFRNTDYRLYGNLADCYRLTAEDRARAQEAYAKAIEMAQAVLATNPRDAVTHALVALYRARAGKPDQALGEISTAQAQDPDNADVQYQAAIVYTLAGRRDQALDALERAVHSGFSAALARSEPDFAALRREPRFRAVMP